MLAALYLIGLSRAWGDLAVAAAVVAATGALRRAAAVLATAGLVFLAFPPYAWPLVYLAASAPLFALWRYGVGDDRYWWLEAFMAGLAMAWLAAPFLGGAVGDHHRWVHLIACSLIGMQMIPVAAVIRFTRPWPAPTAALTAALALTVAEAARVTLFDFPVLQFALPAAPTPLAQWARYITVFGVSGLINAVAFLLVPDCHRRGWRRWIPTGLGASLGAALWIGGTVVAVATPLAPLPLDALLVQPHVRAQVSVNGRDRCAERVRVADRYTTEALAAGAGRT